MSEATIRFNAEPHHRFQSGELELHGGETAAVPADVAEALAQNVPEIEIVDGPVRGKGRKTPDQTADLAEAGDTTKEED